MSQPGRFRVVLDCTVFLQAASRPSGPAARLFIEFLESGNPTLTASDEILTEVREVFCRPHIRAKNPIITDEKVEAFFRRIDQIAEKIDDVPPSYSLPRDPDDEPYLNLAIAANADYLVTWDNDLLDLMTDEAFRAQYPRLTILNPVALLQLLTPPPQQQPRGKPATFTPCQPRGSNQKGPPTLRNSESGWPYCASLSYLVQKLRLEAVLVPHRESGQGIIEGFPSQLIVPG